MIASGADADRRLPDCCARVRKLFDQVAKEPRFQEVAGLVGQEAADDAILQLFQTELDGAEIRHAKIVHGGGWAGRRPPKRQIVMALAPIGMHKTAAAHELLHLARDVHGRMPLDAPLTFGRTCKEEGTVWQLTWRYAPWRASLVLFVWLVVLVGIPLTAIFSGLHYALTFGGAGR